VGERGRRRAKSGSVEEIIWRARDCQPLGWSSQENQGPGFLRHGKYAEVYRDGGTGGNPPQCPVFPRLFAGSEASNHPGGRQISVRGGVLERAFRASKSRLGERGGTGEFTGQHGQSAIDVPVEHRGRGPCDKSLAASAPGTERTAGTPESAVDHIRLCIGPHSNEDQRDRCQDSGCCAFTGFLVG
jgi:hypothetical protein